MLLKSLTTMYIRHYSWTYFLTWNIICGIGKIRKIWRGN